MANKQRATESSADRIAATLRDNCYWATDRELVDILSMDGMCEMIGSLFLNRHNPQFITEMRALVVKHREAKGYWPYNLADKITDCEQAPATTKLFHINEALSFMVQSSEWVNLPDLALLLGRLNSLIKDWLFHPEPSKCAGQVLERWLCLRGFLAKTKPDLKYE